MVLSDKSLKDILSRFRLSEGAKINPASVDLTLGEKAVVFDWPWYYRALWLATQLLFGDEAAKRWSKRERLVDISNGYWLLPGQMALLHSREYVVIPEDTAALLTLKSSRGREGFDHALAGWFDPGFEGQAVFEVYAHHPVRLTAGMRFAQLIYFKAEVPEQPYGQADSHYQGQLGPTKSYEDRRNNHA
jgi:dCTP deaminase